MSLPKIGFDDCNSFKLQMSFYYCVVDVLNCFWQRHQFSLETSLNESDSDDVVNLGSLETSLNEFDLLLP